MDGEGRQNGYSLCEAWRVPQGDLPFFISSPILREEALGDAGLERWASPSSTGGSGATLVARARWGSAINSILSQVRWRMKPTTLSAATIMNDYISKLAQISILQGDTDMTQHGELINIWNLVNPRVTSLWTSAAASSNATGRFLTFQSASAADR